MLWAISTMSATTDEAVGICQAAKQPASLLVPPSGNAPVADESAPVQVARFSNVHSGPPLELDPIVLDIKELPLIQPRLLPLRGILLCPVVADYLDVGGAGRLYTSIRNKSDHTVESIVFTVRSGEARQTIRENVALVPGKHTTAAWHTDPPLPGDAETFLQVDKIVFADGNVWSDGGHGMCSVSASRQATDNTSQLASTLAPAVQQPNPALPLIVQGPARTQGPATAHTGQHPALSCRCDSAAGWTDDCHRFSHFQRFRNRGGHSGSDAPERSPHCGEEGQCLRDNDNAARRHGFDRWQASW